MNEGERENREFLNMQRAESLDSWNKMIWGVRRCDICGREYSSIDEANPMRDTRCIKCAMLSEHEARKRGE